MLQRVAISFIRPAHTCQVVNGSEVNGTLMYQLTDPRTAKEFAQCWDKAKNNWTVLPRADPRGP